MHAYTVGSKHAGVGLGSEAEPGPEGGTIWARPELPGADSLECLEAAAADALVRLAPPALLAGL